jgi:hypothetical protein
VRDAGAKADTESDCAAGNEREAHEKKTQSVEKVCMREERLLMRLLESNGPCMSDAAVCDPTSTDGWT